MNKLITANINVVLTTTCLLSNLSVLFSAALIFNLFMQIQYETAVILGLFGKKT